MFEDMEELTEKDAGFSDILPPGMVAMEGFIDSQ